MDCSIQDYGAVSSKKTGAVDPNTEWWDEDLSRNIFLPIDVERILRISLSASVMEDFVAWNATKSRRASVRPTYYIEWELEFGSRARNDSDATSRTNPVWETLWKLQARSKVKKCMASTAWHSSRHGNLEQHTHQSKPLVPNL